MGRTKRHRDDEWDDNDYEAKAHSAHDDSFEGNDTDDDLSSGEVWREEDELKDWGDDPFSDYRDN